MSEAQVVGPFEGGQARVVLARLLHHADKDLIVRLLEGQVKDHPEDLPQALQNAWDTNFMGLRDKYLDLVHRGLGDLSLIIWSPRQVGVEEVKFRGKPS